MDEKSIRTLLHNVQASVQKVGYTGSVATTRWMTVQCPFAPWTHANKVDQNPSFGITIKPDGRSAYKCLSCLVHGRLAGLPTRLGGYRKKDYSKVRLWAEAHEFKSGLAKPIPDWEDSDEVPAIDYNNPVDPDQQRPDTVDDAGYPRALGVPYLRERGINWVTTLKLDLRFDNMQQRVLFPVYNHYGEFSGFTGRSIRKGNDATRGKDPKVRDYYRLPKRELLLGLRNSTGITIICEGLFDYARLVSMGYYGANAILGTSLTPDKIDILLRRGEPVYFFMDNDLAGWQALFGVPKKDDEDELETSMAWAEKLYRELPVWIVPYKRRLDGTDPGGITDPKQFAWHIRNAWLYTGVPPYTDLLEPTLQHPKAI